MSPFWRTAKINKTVDHIENHAHQQRAIQGPRSKKQSGPFDAPSRLRVKAFTLEESQEGSDSREDERVSGWSRIRHRKTGCT